ncbi:MAG: OsmC family protein [Bdellovibrionaceae bacterium]|nr:OsmC family protein [Pseudobdellovibrionaceae bacterium]
MFKLEMTDSNQIVVQARKYTYNYSIDGSLANPLEATYAALAGCAGVYVLKAAKKLGKSVVGIQIQCKSVIKPENPNLAAKWITEVYFPQGWHSEEKANLLAAIKNCAVKELIQNGSHIDFITEEKTEPVV